jgi:energy-coupling factor transporter ATP-binding protein EcfA2
MITKFKVESFKSIESAEIELGNINVFIGANGSGKSNLLEALGTLAAAAYGRVDEESLIRRGTRPGGIFKPMFRNPPLALNRNSALCAEGDREGSYYVELASPAISQTVWEYKREDWNSPIGNIVDRNSEQKDSPSKGDPQVGLAALKLAEMEVLNPAAIFLKTLAAYSIYAPDTAVLRGIMQDPQVREPVGLAGGRLEIATSDIVREVKLYRKLDEEFRHSIDWFKFFISSPVVGKDDPRPVGYVLGFIDRFFNENIPDGFPFLGAREVNEGALYLLFITVLCLHPASPKLFALDNADHGLNPLLAKRLMTTMCRWLLEETGPRQVLMTTHNPLVLDGLPLQDDRVRLFIVERDNRGTTQVRRFQITEKEISKAKEGWTLSRMWVNGLLGGVPNV